MMKDFELLSNIMDDEFSTQYDEGCETKKKPIKKKAIVESIENTHGSKVPGKAVSSKPKLELGKATAGTKVGTGSPTGAKAPDTKGIAIKSTKVTGKKMKPTPALNDDLACECVGDCTCSKKKKSMVESAKLTEGKTKATTKGVDDKPATKPKQAPPSPTPKKPVNGTPKKKVIAEAVMKPDYKFIAESLNTTLREEGDLAMIDKMKAVLEGVNVITNNKKIKKVWQECIENPRKNYKVLLSVLRGI